MFRRKDNNFLSFIPGKAKNKIRNSQPLSSILRNMIKKLFIFLSISLIPILLILLITFIPLLIVWHIFHPDISMGFLNPILMKASTTNNISFGGIISWAIEAVMAVLYLIFITPILWLLSQFQIIIDFIGSGAVANKMLFDNKDWHGVPTLYFTVLGIAMGVLIIVFTIRLIELKIITQNKKEKIQSTFIGLIFILPILIGIPIAFFLFNILINAITKVIITSSGKGIHDLGLFIFNSSFSNGMHDFSYVPDSWTFQDSGKFNYLQCLLSEGFMIYILLQISVFLFIRLAEQMILLITGGIWAAMLVQDEGRKFRNWKNITMNRFISFSMVFLAYTIFLNSIAGLSELANLIPQSSARPIFTLIGTFGFGITVIKSPQLLSTIIGGNVGLADGIGNLIQLKTTTSGFQTGIKLIGAGTKIPLNSYKGTSSLIGKTQAIGYHGIKNITKVSLIKPKNEAFEYTAEKFKKWIKNEEPGEGE